MLMCVPPRRGGKGSWSVDLGSGRDLGSLLRSGGGGACVPFRRVFPRPAVSTTDVQCATIQRCGVSFFAVGIAQRPGSSILARLYPRCSGMGHPVADCPLFKHPTVHYFSIIRLFLCRGPPPPIPATAEAQNRPPCCVPVP